jgi:hypothetical protein
MELFNYKITAANYSAKQFVLFRAILGTYLLVHFLSLLPYCTEMFSREGIFGNPELNFTYGFFPDVLNYFDSAIFIKTFIIILAFLSLFFIFGFQRRTVSLLLWYGWACLINRNNMIINPGMPYIGWLLLMCVFIPSGENKVLNNEENKWTLPSWSILGAWLIMGFGYTLSGFDKLHSPSWLNGNTFSILLNNPLSRNTDLREMSLNIPHAILQLITWGVLASEFLFLSLALFSRTRKYAWILMVLMHLCILCYINFTDLTIGMLMIHLFTFDREWVKNLFIKKAGKNFNLIAKTMI